MPSPLMEMLVTELLHDLERERLRLNDAERLRAARPSRPTLHFGAVRRTIGTTLVRAGFGIAGAATERGTA